MQTGLVNDRLDDRIAGALLVASALLTIAALSHHPSVEARQAGDFVKALAAVGTINGPFHTFMIVMIVALYVGLVGFSLRRGLQSVLVLAGLVAASLGVGAEVGAALIDGFFGPAFGAHLLRGNPASIAQAMPVISAAALALQILAKFGLFSMTAAIVLWSVDLLTREPRSIILASIGCFGGAATLVATSTVATSLTSHNTALVFGIQALWYAVAGALMIRRRL